MTDEESDTKPASDTSCKVKPSLIVTYDPLVSGSIDGTDEYPHDRAIWRAMETPYIPCKHIGGEPKNTIFIAKLHKDTTESSIRGVFSEFGNIKKCSLIRDIVTGFSKCYAFVELEDAESAQRAYRAGGNLYIDNKKVIIDYECGRLLQNWKPRRLGGGFGGVKESGQLRFGGRFRPYKKPLKELETIPSSTFKESGRH